jgi:PD-(D/E)XK endonuclease
MEEQQISTLSVGSSNLSWGVREVKHGGVCSYHFSLLFYIGREFIKMLEQKNTVMQGNVGLALAIAYFAIKGYPISIPLNDTQDYDLIIDIEGVLKKVQVKTSNCKNGSGNYQVELRSKYGGKGNVSKFFNENSSDILFVVDGDGNQYLIPIEDIKSKTTITLSAYKQFRI